MAKKFYKTILQIEILSENEPMGEYPLHVINYEITEGSCSGRSKVISETELTGEQAAKALREQGSDPSLFQLDYDGTELPE